MLTLKKEADIAAGGRELTLAFNAAEGRLQFVLARGSDILCAQDWAASSRGTEILAPALERSFALLRLSFAELARIACVRGPGSFTGIRLVLTTAAALARASGALLAGFDYMELSAQSALARICGGGLGKHARHIQVLTHAKRDLVHAQTFTANQGETFARPTSSLELLHPESCAERLREALSNGLDIAAVGSGWTRHKALQERLDTEIDGLLGRLLRLPAHLPTPGDLLLLALRAEYGEEDIEPLYARPCDAVENLAAIAAKRGDEPASAEARLAALLNASPGES